MNRDEGQYNLSHIFNDLLMNKRKRNTLKAGNSVAKQHSSTELCKTFYNSIEKAAASC